MPSMSQCQAEREPTCQGLHRTCLILSHNRQFLCIRLGEVPEMELRLPVRGALTRTPYSVTNLDNLAIFEGFQ